MSIANLLVPNHYKIYAGEVIVPVAPITIGNIDLAGNSDGMVLEGTVLSLTEADAINGGIVTVNDQEWSGVKRFMNNIIVEGDTNLNGDLAVAGNTNLAGDLAVTGDTNLTGDTTVAGDTFLNGDVTVLGTLTAPGVVPVTLGAFGSTSNTAGATLFGQQLTLQPASVNFGGGVSANTLQSFSGVKTFTSGLVVPSPSTITTPSVLLPSTTDANTGVIKVNGTPFMHSYPGSLNTSLGANAGSFTASAGGSSTCIGAQCGRSRTTGAITGLGASAGQLITTAFRCTCIGSSSSNQNIAGNDQTSLGANAGAGALGNQIISIGSGSGANLASEDFIIEISDGTFISPAYATGDIRIGQASTARNFQKGIYNVTPIQPLPRMVVVDSAHQLGSQSIAPLTTNFTMTLDSGTITTSTVRGASTAVIPLSLTRIGQTVNLVIPAFSITAQSGGAFTVTLTGVGVIDVNYRPTYACAFTVPCIDNALFTTAIIYVTTGGIVSMQLLTGVAFTLPTGLQSYDMGVSWIIV